MDFVEDTLAISLGPDPNIVVRRKRTLREDKVGAFTGKKEFNREYTFTVINRKKARHPLAIGRPASAREPRRSSSTDSSWTAPRSTKPRAKSCGLTVKAGDLEERKMRYVIESPRELMVLAD